MSFSVKKIQSNTLGGLLKKARLYKRLELKDISKQISIGEKYLEFLEDDNFYKLPSPTYIKGFLKCYAEFLKLDSEMIVKKWDQEFNSKNKEIKKQKYRTIKSYKTNKFNFKTILIGLAFCLLLVYIGYGIKGALFKPEIEILSPVNDLVTKESSLVINGKTEPRAEVFINGQPVQKIKNGVFEQKIELLPGLNVIKISAKKKYSKKRVIYRRVVLVP